MKAIDFLKAHRDGCLDSLSVEIRVDNWNYKTVKYDSIEVANEEPILQKEMIDWFIADDHTIMINCEGEKT